MTHNIALIVAAGSGQRFKSPIPKQYQDIGGMPILRRTVLAFLNHPLIDGVQIVYSPQHQDLYDRAVEGLDLPAPISGGATRQDSVRLGLEDLALLETPPDNVLIHDGARPLVDTTTITNVCKALETHEGAIAARQVVDTLKKAEDGTIDSTIDRQNLWQAFTPQAFHFQTIFQAHIKGLGQQFTDDASACEHIGVKVALIPSNPDNMKITNPDDMDRAARALGQSYGDIRTGLGFDVHALIDGTEIILGGLKIPHNKSLKGHSDADVILHALTDAILGTFAGGDIGTHFPPSDPKWKGADSGMLLRQIVQMVSERGGLISNVDMTIMCEEPKLGPHREAMQDNIAGLLDIDKSRVSVKATTTERLGFTGRGEGIACQAIATVRYEG